MNRRNCFSTKALANEWKISHRSLQRWRAKGCGPAYIRLGRSIRYTPEAVKAFEASPEFSQLMAEANRQREVRS